MIINHLSDNVRSYNHMYNINNNIRKYPLIYTGYDKFPNKFWFRGIHNSSIPSTANREAGIFITNRYSNKMERRTPEHNSDLKFQNACNITLP